MQTEKFTFPGHSGEMLAARLDLPAGKPRAVALFAHCFTCSKDIIAARRVAAGLADHGIAVLRFDFTGLGNSEGAFETTTFSSNVADLHAAVSELARRGMTPSLLIGHSLGGAAVLRAAPDIASIKGVVTIGAPADPGHVTHNFGAALATIKEHGVAAVDLGGRSLNIGKGFVDDVATSDLKPALAKLKAALLVLHAPRDTVVGIENASEIFLAAKHPKSFVTLDDADHLLSSAADADYAVEVITAWSRRYLPQQAKPATPKAPEGILRVTENDASGFAQTITTGGHTLTADEPVKLGGTDTGPSPYGLLSAGLGACTSMTIRMYARRKGWPLDSVSVDVDHGKCHATDSAQGDKIDCFTRTIHLQGDLDDDQRTRLLEIADKCPVHKTLERTNEIVTTLA
ncbi:putative redox protein [Loktanella ponticola]|uniref:Putative redox protein n=1 Tax=Yoonia ponticola TaxID=1524255 RepID=A0A7W9EZM7_9RHOB|nr:alpha/beta fold hydrolase [Yoonia ponticola]MBB5722096.1 putative redox protein [Yoonia ponticola]